VREKGLPKVIGRGMIIRRIFNLSLEDYGRGNDKMPILTQTGGRDMKDSVEELTKRKNNIKMPPFDNIFR